jgi:hypothetical protein
MQKSNILSNRKYKKVLLYVWMYGKIWLFSAFSYIFSYMIYFSCYLLIYLFSENKKNRIRRNAFSKGSSKRMGAWGGAVSLGNLPQAGRSRIPFRMGSTKPLNRNEYQAYLMGDKGDRCVRLTTFPLSCADCVEILEALQPLRVCVLYLAVHEYWPLVLIQSSYAMSVSQPVNPCRPTQWCTETFYI